jgi:hypothetical protein
LLQFLLGSELARNAFISAFRGKRATRAASLVGLAGIEIVEQLVAGPDLDGDSR